MSSFASFLFCSVFEIRFQIWFTYAIFIHQASHWCKLVYGKIVSNFIRRKTEMIYFQIYSSHVRVRFQPTDDIFPRSYLKLNKNDFSLFVFFICREENYETFSLFFDLAGTGLKNLDLDYTKQLVNTLKAYYPNALNYIFVFELPWILTGNDRFKFVWHQFENGDQIESWRI